MSRLYISNARGRQPMFSGPRAPRAKSTNNDDTYKEKSQKKRKINAKHRVTTPTRARRTRVAASQQEEDSTTSGVSADEAGDESENEDADEPEEIAPSRTGKDYAAGRYDYDRSEDNLSEISDQESLFNDDDELAVLPNVSLEDDDDDEVYRKVDDISESDLDNVSEDEMIRYEGELNLMSSVSNATEDEDPSAFYLNQIEGMSAYGFGETSEAEGSVHFQMSSQSDDDGNPTFHRHVRFEDTFPEGKSVFRLSQSPTMTRALLPSALPAQIMTAKVEAEYGVQADSDSDIDSDVTDDALPEGVSIISDNEQPPEEPSPVSDEKKTPKLKGPPTGRFVDDGDTSVGILDSTGKVLIITNPHRLGQEFVKRYGPSEPASPGLGFAEAVFEEEPSQNVPDTTVQAPDPMLSSLSTNTNVAGNGQAMGPPEAWFADSNLMRSILAEDVPDVEGLDHAEHMMSIHDVITFDSDSEESPTSPIYMSADVNATPRDQVSHLDSTNIMSFRRAADPAYAALQSSPTTPHSNYMHTPRPSHSRKRKSRNDSPYSTALYKGVTPVQRTTGFHQGATILMDSPVPAKRRKITN